MFPRTLTESALRAIQAAGRLAAFDNAPALSAEHLLWALVLQESRANGILGQYGIDDTELRRCEILAPEAVDAEVQRMETIGGSDNLAAELDRSGDSRFGETLDWFTHSDRVFLDQIMASAEHLARGLGTPSEIGSDHLLGGILTVESSVQRLLHKYGLLPSTFRDQLIGKAGGLAPPLEVNLELNTVTTVESDRSRALRIVDAAANRTREGLRVLEDYARFVLDSRPLTDQLKQIRHDLAAALQCIDSAELIAARDTAEDVGTSLTSMAESQRESLTAVATAACKRVQEGFRTLEEFGKVLSSHMAEQFKQLRYRSYIVEQQWVADQQTSRRLAGRSLYLLATSSRCPGDLDEAVRLACVNGVGVVQIREKEMPDRELLEHIRRLRPIVKDNGALLIVNDRPDLAVLAEADGVHVGQEELSVRDARRIVGTERLVGVSTHSIEQARRAVSEGADYLGVGPTFPSRTKTFSELAGLNFVRQVADEITRPWYAIGGITLDNLPDVIAAGATRVAITDAICGSDSPGEVTARLRDLLDKPRP